MAYSCMAARAVELVKKEERSTKRPVGERRRNAATTIQMRLRRSSSHCFQRPCLLSVVVINLLWLASTPGISTRDILDLELNRARALSHPDQHFLDPSSTPATPMMSQNFCFPFPVDGRWNRRCSCDFVSATTS
jgi:hypothetical protein